MAMTSSVYSGTKGLLLFLLLSLGAWGQEEQLKGSIKNAYWSQAIDGVRVTVHETGQYTFTDSLGSFQINLLPGHYHLHFEKSGYVAQDLDLDFPSTKSVEIRMIPSQIELDEVLIEDPFLFQSNRKYSQEILSIRPSEGEQAAQMDLGGILENLPGVSGLQTGLGISKPVIRGFMGNRVAVIDDGIKQEGQQWGMDHGLEIDPFQVQSIELLKGPAALQYGSDAIGGALRLLPEVLPERTWSGGVQTAYHSNNQNRAISAYLAYRKGALSSRIRLSRKEYEDFRVPAEEFQYNSFVLPITDNTLKNTAGRQSSAQWELSWNKDSYHSRYRISIYQQEQGLYPGAIGIPRAFDVGNIGETDNIDLPRQEIRHLKLYSQQNIRIKDHWLELELGYQLNDRAERSLPHAHGFEELDSGATLALGLELHSFQANFRYRLHWGEADIVFGSSQQYQNNFQSGFEYLIPNYQSYQSGVFALAKGEINDRLIWDGGLRWEFKSQRSPLSTTRWWSNIDSIVVRSPEINQNFSNLAGAAGLVFNPNPHWILKAHLARSFRAPNVAELSSNGVHHGTFRHEVGDASLNPELAWQIDGTAEYQNEDLLVRLSPYFYYFDNYIFLRPTAQFSLLPEAGQLYVYQQAPIIQGGTELYIDWHPWKKLHWSNASEFLLNENLETNLPLPFSPPWSNLSSLRWEEDKWQVSLKWRYTWSQDQVDRNENTTPEYHLFHLNTAYRWELENYQVLIHAGVQNLFNTAYLRHLSRYRILNLPEQGRNIIAGLSIKF